MKKRALVIGFLFCFGITYCQKKGLKDLYEKAITIHIKQMEGFNGKNINLDSVYFTFVNISKENLPEKIENKTINYFDIYNAKNKKRLKKRMAVIAIAPLELNGNNITISLVNSVVEYKSKKYFIGYGDGSKAVFEYSCSEDTWIAISDGTN